MTAYDHSTTSPTPPFTSTWLSTTPSTSIASATHLANMGVGIGAGVNPNVTSSGGGNGSDSIGTIGSQTNPPIVNTGNNGPMCVQPGDWVCSSCCFVNWRRRKVCMRCFPFADPNEVSHSIASGAVLAAQLAAGIEPSPEAITSLAQPRRNTTATPTRNAMASNIDANGAASILPLGITTSSPSCSSPAVSTLPPRPDTRLARRGLALPSVSIHSNPDLLQRRMMSSQERYQGKQDQLEDVLLQSLSLRGGLFLPSLTSSTSSPFPSSSHSNNKNNNKSPALLTSSPKPTSTSGSFLSPMAAPYIARSPSMPTLASCGTGGLLPPNYQNIWKSSTPGKGASDLSPLASLHPFTPSTYQSYTPTTVFASTPPPSNTNTEVRNGGSSSSTSLGPNLGLSNDIWNYNNHLGIGFGSRNNNNNSSSSRSSNSNNTSPSTVGLYSSLLQDSPIIDGIPSWLEVESSSLLPSTPFSGSSSSSTIKASKCNRSPPIIDDFPGQ